MPRTTLHTPPSAAELDELHELCRRAGLRQPRNLDYELTRKVLRMRCLYRLRRLSIKPISERVQAQRTLKTPVIDVRKRAANDHD